MAKLKPTKIILKSRADGVETELPLEDPGIYDNFIIPGMLIERTTSNTVQPHSTAGGNASPLFALEMPFIGVDGAYGEGRAFDDPYTEEGETVRFFQALPGTWVNALLAAGADVAIGALLQSAGDGTLMEYDASGATPLRPVARAVEAIDNDPGTGGAAVRCKVEVL